ncbi:MAG: hypothetical protein KAI66_09455, partial [Lentisphaeria bacterium]|nr:hypothetical protein [Lentisphaeria bacterium]
WHAGADLYRAWFRENITPMPVPKWLKEAQGYVMSGGATYEFGQLPRILANAQAMGIDYIQLWSEMTGGEISYHAFGYPNPYMGTEKDLKKALRDVHKAGGHVGVYLNYNTGDPLLGTFVRQPRLAQKIPKRIPRPALDYIGDNWVQQSIMSHEGNYSMWSTSVPGYLDDYWNVCPASDKWSALYKYWVVDLWAKQYKLDVWYLDSCPVSRGSPCFAFDHGHADPMPEGQAVMDFYVRMRKDAPKNFCIMQEYGNDRLLQWGTHALGLMWHPRHAHPEVVRYTLPEMIFFSGMCNGYSGVKQFYKDERVTFIDALERVFLIGNRFELSLSHQPPILISEYKRNLVALRKACTNEMNYGDFLDDTSLGIVPDRVHIRLFRAPDRKRLVITMLDRRHAPDRTPFTFELDLARAAAGTEIKLWLRTLAGENIPLKHSRNSSVLKLEIPSFKDRPAAVFIETSGLPSSGNE